MDPVEAFDLLFKTIERRARYNMRGKPSRHALRNLLALCTAVEEMVDLSGSRSIDEQIMTVREVEVRQLRRIAVKIELMLPAR